MALSVPSRFACLKIEDDDFHPPNQMKPKEKKKIEVKSNNKKAEKNGTTKKPPPKPQPPQPPQQKKEKKKKETAEQWEEWKEKDQELVTGTFEKDLKNALLLSVLDFEEKKKLNKGKDNDDKKSADAQNSKKKKNKAMSLEQFNTMVNNGKPEIKATNGDNVHLQVNEHDEKFFERVKNDAKEELHKELKKEQNKENKNENKKVRKPFNDETITIAQYQAKLEVQQQENAMLKSKLEKAHKEIFAVKTRNKTLCGILAHGEMKDKADVLMELHRLSKVRDELTEEVSRLHGLLEQERSKVGALTAAEPHTHNKHHSKDKNRRKIADTK